MEVSRSDLVSLLEAVIALKAILRYNYGCIKRIRKIFADTISAKVVDVIVSSLFSTKIYIQNLNFDVDRQISIAINIET